MDDTLGDILLKVFVVFIVVGILGALAYDDRRTRKIREAEDRAAAEADNRNRAGAGD